LVIAVPTYKIAYSAVPKAGCSSVKAALAYLDPSVVIPPKGEITVMTWHGIYPTTRFLQKEWDRHSDYWRFTVVRDPIRRLMSVYTNRVVQLQELKNSRKLRDRPEFSHLSTTPDPDFFFQNIRDYMRAASVIKHHCLGTSLFIGPRPLQYDRIYKTEEMNQLALDLAERTGQPVQMPRENTSTMKLRLGDLAPKTIDALRPMLDAEYKHLSEFFENPL
jgi:hypothetical protein